MTNPELGANILKVSLGAGRAALPGFKTVDLDLANSPDFLMDIRDLKFEPASVSVLYSSHVFEHLKPYSANSHLDRWTFLINLLSSWRKCLTSDGRLYICVPDMRKLAKLLTDYSENISTEQICLDAIFGGARNEFDYHYSGFTREILTSLLSKAGFKNIEVFEAFADDESTHKICGVDISLNLVAFNAEGIGVQAIMPTEPAKVTSELSMYRDAADERLIQILMLKQVCDDREKVIQNLSNHLALYEGQFNKQGKLKSKIKSLLGL